MPECHRCGRVQATAELRRTTLGYLCKENSVGSRCWTLARERREQARRIPVCQLALELERGDRRESRR